MTERLITFACALGALALFLVLFVNPGAGMDARARLPRPTTEERGGNGYHAAYAWMSASRLHTVSLRERFNALATHRDLPAAGNVLVVTLPGKQAVGSKEPSALGRWLGAGNTIIVLAAIADDPDWAQAAGGVRGGDLALLTALGVKVVPQGGQGFAGDVALVPNREHAYFAGVERVVAASGHSHAEGKVDLPFDSFLFALAHEEGSGKAALWTRPLGQGRVVISGLGSIFTDTALGRADNARFLANIVGANLGPDGAVIFDDFHQGLSVAYDPEKFYSDPRLYMTGAILLALWFLWVLGATRLRVPAVRTAAPREADLVRANGRFLARVLPSDAAARALVAHFLRRVRARMPQARGTLEPWEYLETSSRIAAADLAQLKRWQAQARTGKGVPLLALYNLILRIEGQIA